MSTATVKVIASDEMALVREQDLNSNTVTYECLQHLFLSFSGDRPMDRWSCTQEPVSSCTQMEACLCWSSGQAVQDFNLFLANKKLANQLALVWNDQSHQNGRCISLWFYFNYHLLITWNTQSESLFDFFACVF